VEVAMMDAILRTYQPSQDFSGPGDVLSYINRHLFTRQLRGVFITTITFVYDSETEIFNYSSAGHLPAIIKPASKKDEVVILDQATDIPLGIMREHTWGNAETRVKSGDCIILYTDGITESKNRSGKEFGIHGILEAVEDISDPNPQLIVNSIMESLYKHRGTKDHVDDETILVLQPQ
jgi:serine phosphatase RsbU (regulator of sigma subunit)